MKPVDRDNTTFVGREKIEKTVNELMGSGEAAEEMRKKAGAVGKVATRAVEEGG